MIFTDGASSGNPGPGGWGVIVVRPDGKIAELGGASSGTTNNRMELAAVIRGLEEVSDLEGEIDVYTDSTYVIRGITQWIWNWMRNGWRSSEGEGVANQDLWKILNGILIKRGKANGVKWKYVRGHSGIPGNERVDEIAVVFSKGKRPNLFRGSLFNYDVPIYDLPEGDHPLPAMKPRTESKPAAFSYLSLVNGVPMRHLTWKECEARVKGRPGAKFKKAMSESEEREIFREWGIRNLPSW